MRKPKSLGTRPAINPAPSSDGNAAGSGTDAESLLQGLPWGVVVFDAHGTVLRLNELAAHWWGMRPQQVQGKPVRAATAGTLPADLLQALQAVSSSPSRTDGEFFLPKHQQWIALSSAPHGDGRVVYWQDVTAQKQRQQTHETQQAASDRLRDETAREQAAQELLRGKDELAHRATDKYGALYNSMDEGFCILEVLFDEAQRPVDYRFLNVNPAFEAQTGLREVVGKTMRELVPGTEVFSIEIHGRVARTGEPARFEGYAESLGRWFDVNSFPIGPAADRQVGVLFTDSSARKRAEEALRQSEARYRSLFNNMEQGFCLLEKLATGPGEPSDFRYLVVNPAFERHTGLADAAGRTIRELVPSFEPHIMTIYDEAVASGEPCRFEEYVAGRDIWFEAEVVPEAQPGHLAVLFSNVSARRLAE